MLIVLIIAGLLLALAPQLWVRAVMRRHNVARSDFPGTGGEFARHVLNRLGLESVGVEATDSGDHYDPQDRVVRLSRDNFSARSLTAVVVAAHEVGHAMQDASGYPALETRTRLAKLAIRLQKVGAVMMFAAPLIFVLVRSPVALLIQAALAVVVLGTSVLLHLVTLPVELDASFRRALPVLETGRYLRPEDLPAARSILRAAALTYVAAAAMSLLNVAAWIRVLR
jgi:Zn-dependent membrane protease YugP